MALVWLSEEQRAIADQELRDSCALNKEVNMEMDHCIQGKCEAVGSKCCQGNRSRNP